MRIFRGFVILLSIVLVASGCVQHTWDRKYEITMSHAPKRCEGKQDVATCIADIEKEASLARDEEKKQAEARSNTYILGVVIGGILAAITMSYARSLAED